MIKLNVPDMSCNHCVGAITGAIKAIDPQAGIKTDLAAKTVTIETTHSLANIAKAVDDAGFPNTAA